MYKAASLLILLLLAVSLFSQNTIALQGFEVPPSCPEWSYVGGVVNTETARTGTRSCRVGRASESNTVTFAAQTITGYANVVLSLYHSVRGGSGPGMDTDEGAQIEVQLNGGAWTMIGRVSGFGDFAWGWATNPGGNAFNGCAYTCANGLFYNVPAGTTTLALRVFSQFGNGCPKPLGNYNRSDEGFFIDDVRLTTTSPVITPGTGTLTWTGAVSTDWFQCANWTPQVVPGPGHDVIIEQTGSNQCVVGVNIATPVNAYASTLVVRSNNAVNRTLTINNGRSLSVGGVGSVQRSAGAGQLGITVQNGNFTSGGLTLTGTGVGTVQALFRNIVATNIVQIIGNVTIAPGGILDLQGAPGGVMGVAGNLVNNDGAAGFPKTGSQVILNGTVGQNMGSVTAGGEPYASLRIAKPAGFVTLNAPISVSGTLDMLQGVVFSSAANLLTVQSGALVTNTTNASFVNGPVRKRGNTNFTFPVGKSGVYRPITITSPGGNSALFFTAEYFLGDPSITFGTPLDATLDHISQCEWWILDRSAAQTPLVTLSWDATSCGVTSLPDLRVAEWYLGQWRDRGNGGTTGTVAAGTVLTAGPQSQFAAPTPWTLASISDENPLPIELISFDAVAQKDVVLAQWSTTSEWNNEGFNVERSADGLSYASIGQIPGAGNSMQQLWYELVDHSPLPGLSYYRLRQTDLDGTCTLSQVVAVHFDVDPVDQRLSVHVDGSGIQTWHDLPSGSSYELFDTTGRLLLSGTTHTEGSLILNDLGPCHGVLLLRLVYGHDVRTVHFVR